MSSMGDVLVEEEQRLADKEEEGQRWGAIDGPVAAGG